MGRFLLLPRAQRSKSAASGVHFTLHGVVFDIFVRIGTLAVLVAPCAATFAPLMLGFG
jgi:hypothetical protein